MKIKVKLSKDSKIFVNLSNPNLKNLKEEICKYLSERGDPIPSSEIQLSLNGVDAIIASDEENLANLGIVNGDILTLLKTTQNNIETIASSKTENRTCSFASSNSSIAKDSNEMSASSKEVHKMGVFDSADKLDNFTDKYDPKNIDEYLNILIHCCFLERQFICNVSEGYLPDSWNSPVSTTQYKHVGFNNFNCTLVIVKMGNVKQIMVSFPGQESEISIKIEMDKFIVKNSKTSEIDLSSIKVFDFTSIIKNQLLYPLQVSAHERLGVPAPWHLVGLVPELILTISKYLDCKSIIRLSQTCKRLNTVLNDNFIWEKLFKKDFPLCNLQKNADFKENYKKEYIRKKENEKKREDIHIIYPDGQFPQIPLRGQNPYPGNMPFRDPDSPYFSGEIPHPPGPGFPGIIGDPNPLGPYQPHNPYINPNPFGGPRYDPFGSPFNPPFGRRGGSNRGPRFDFL